MEEKDEAEKVDEVFNIIKEYYMIYYDDPPVYSVKSCDFFVMEEQIYHLKKRIDDLDKIISSLLEKLNSMDFPDKNNIIEQVQKQQGMVKSYQIDYKKKFDFCCDNYKFYMDTFDVYKSKYYSAKYNKKKLLDIFVTIQELIRDNFFAFYNQYSLIRQHYKESNEYILKIKEKFK